MRAWRVERIGEPELRDDLPEPDLEPGSMRLEVEAIAPNFADGLQIRGEYQERPALPFTPGLEVAGTIAAIADDVEGWSAGERVVGMPISGHGAWAERTLTRPALVVPVPEGIELGDAIAVHVNAQTAWFALHHRGALAAGETVLVHAAAGGVGSAAVQLAKAHGATVVATCSDAKAELPARLGADVVVDRRGDWISRVKEAVGTVDVVVDPAGGAMFEGSTKVIGFEGRIVTVGFASGSHPSVRANHVLVKNYAVVGLYWNRYLIERPDVVRRAAEEIFGLLAAGRLEPSATDGGGLERAVHWAAEIQAGRTTGKVVCRV